MRLRSVVVLLGVSTLLCLAPVARAADLLWQVPLGTFGGSTQNSPAPVAGDIDGDGLPEILVGMLDAVYVFDAAGVPKVGWPAAANSGPLAPPSVGDINGDGSKDIVFIEALGLNNDERIVALDNLGQVLPGFPLEIVAAGANSVSHFHLALGNVIGDAGLEIIVADNVPIPRVYVIDGAGQFVPGFPLDLPVPGNGPPGTVPPIAWSDDIFVAGITTANLDGDEYDEILASFRVYSEFNSRHAVLWALRGDGTVAPGWPQIPGIGGGAGPLIATDLEGDGTAELVMTGDRRMQLLLPDGTWIQRNYMYNNAGTYHPVGRFGGVLRGVSLGSEIQLFELYPPGTQPTTSTITSSATDGFLVYQGGSIGDVDGDGLQELAVWTLNSNTGSGMYLHLLDEHLNAKPGWPKLFSPYISANFAQYATTMVDLDGDGDMEIVHSYDDQLYAWNQPAIGTTPAAPIWPMRNFDIRQSNNPWQYSGPSAAFLRGDATRDGSVNLADVVKLLSYSFQGEQTTCVRQLDVNTDGSVDLVDAVSLLQYLFQSSAAPNRPFPSCEGIRLTPGLGCVASACP